MIINNIEYKKYDDNYYVSANGDIWSEYSKKNLKHYIDHDGYHRVDIHGKHIKVHKLVYLTWIGDIKENYQINHKDDDKNNNYYTNLYSGTQLENIRDCINNRHRVGNIQYFIVKEKKSNKLLIFQPANKFFDYCGHCSKNRNISRILNRNWFKKDYEMIGMGKGVTTIESVFDETQ